MTGVCRNCCKIFCSERNLKEECSKQISFRKIGQIDKLERGEKSESCK